MISARAKSIAVILCSTSLSLSGAMSVALADNAYHTFKRAVESAQNVTIQQTRGCDGKKINQACNCDHANPPNCGKCVMRDGVGLDCDTDNDR